MLIKKIHPRCQVFCWIESIGEFQSDEKEAFKKSKKENQDQFRFYGPYQSKVMNHLEEAKAQGESFGAVLKCVINSCPKYLGEPVFRKLKSDLAMAMTSIGAVSGFDFGDGIAASYQKGTDFHTRKSKQQYGGIRGGITTGEPITFRVFIKPTSSILDVAKKGRHDPCIGIRAVAVIEAMAYLVLADQVLLQRGNRV